MEHAIQENKKQYALVLVLIPEDAWRKDPTLPRNFAHSFLNSINRLEEELIVLNPCTFLCSVELAWRVAPQLFENAKVYNVETQILPLDQKPSWITSK